MRRNYTEEEINFKISASHKQWEKYKATREARRQAARHKIAVAIVAEELRQESNG